MRLLIICLLVVWGTGICLGQDDRIGFEETCDTIEGWEYSTNPGNCGPLRSFTSENGRLIMVTPTGALNHRMKRTDWPEWPEKPIPGFTNMSKTYDVEIDFSKYRYLVAKIDSKGTFFMISIRASDQFHSLKVGYTAGINVQDLYPLDCRGKRNLQIHFQFLNTSNKVELDYIRLVNELTPLEEAALIPNGLTVWDEKIKGSPYHGLEALSARAHRPARKDPPGEWVVYRDESTAATVWRMTGAAGNEKSPTFNCDGSAFKFMGRGGKGFWIHDFSAGGIKHFERGVSDPNSAARFSNTDPSSLLYLENEWLEREGEVKPRKLHIISEDIRTGESDEVAAFVVREPWRVNEWVNSPDSDKMVFAPREFNAMYLIDPSIADKDKRVRRIELPTRLKGAGIINNDRWLRWYNCYTYEPWYMDLATETVTHAPGYFAGGHSAGGPRQTIGPYGSIAKLLVPYNAVPVTAFNRDIVSMYANYAKPVPTDYGHISRDGKWMITDGNGSHFRGQHLMFDTRDPGTVLRIVYHNTSRNDWALNTYSRTSPEYTKIAYVSDQLGNGDIYLALTRRPDEPIGLKAEKLTAGVQLNWTAPQRSKEIKGYNIYRTSQSGREYSKLNDKPLEALTFLDQDADPDSPAFYAIAGEEFSGLEGIYSQEAAVSAAGRSGVIYAEGERADLSLPMRRVFNGDCSAFQYIRVTPEDKLEEQKAGEAVFTLNPPVTGNYRILLRARHERDGEAQIIVKVNGKDLATEKNISGGNWQWIALNEEQPVSLAAGAGAQKLTLISGTAGLAIDCIALSSDADFIPSGLDTRDTIAPGKVKGFAAEALGPQGIKLSWEALPDKDLDRYDVHVLEDNKTELSNATILCSTRGLKTEDWGLRPGSDCRYAVVAVDKRGNRSEPSITEVKTTAAEVTVLALDAAVPDPGQPLTFAFDLPAAGDYMLWAHYAPANVDMKKMRMDVTVDSLKGSWRLRAPYRPMSRALAKGGKADQKWYSDKIKFSGKDIFPLEAGKHTITVTWDKEAAHELKKLYISNDHSFRPAGWDPRADMKKFRKH